jgi:hypothetical protein
MHAIISPAVAAVSKLNRHQTANSKKQPSAAAVLQLLPASQSGPSSGRLAIIMARQVITHNSK